VLPPNGTSIGLDIISVDIISVDIISVDIDAPADRLGLRPRRLCLRHRFVNVIVNPPIRRY